VFDWAHQTNPGEDHEKWHCVIYKPNPGVKGCNFYLEAVMIITLENQKPSADEIERIESNQRRYDTDPELKKLADEIHNSRMMSGPACPQCICMALDRLTAKKSVPANRE
jgi:hypothetical protein